MGVLEAWYPDIHSFIKAKEKGGFENFNISIMTDEAFWQAYHSDGKYPLINQGPDGGWGR